jgi:hypothetical protein
MEHLPSRTDYRIVDVDGRRILSVLCGSTAIYEFRTELTALEQAGIGAGGAATPALVEAIRHDPRAFRYREFKPR